MVEIVEEGYEYDLTLFLKVLDTYFLMINVALL